MKFRLVLTFTEINLTSQKYYERHSMAEGALNKTRENQLQTTKLKTIRAKKVNTQNSNSRFQKIWGCRIFSNPIFSNQEFSTNFQHEKLEEITKKLEEITFFKKNLFSTCLGFVKNVNSIAPILNSITQN